MVDLNPHRATMARIRLDAAGPERFVLGMGDSRTEQVPWSFIGSPANRFNFINWGVSGATTKQYRDFLCFEMAGVNYSSAKGAVVALGTNDVWWGDSSDEFLNFEQYYLDIIYALGQRGLRVACCTPTPFENTGAVNALWAAPLLETISQKIRSLCARTGLALVDYNAAFRIANLTAMPGLTSDGVHFSYAGLCAHWEYASPIISQRFT